ncbi:MAG TPA: hypothetical protein VN636_15900 [Acidimicrobiia bacterium]|nr:hypothetical protein [Acidimicrobiia bacterium]
MTPAVLRRSRLRRSVGLFVAPALVAALTACSGGGGHAQKGVTTTTAPNVKTAALKIGTVDVESAGADGSVDSATRRAVLVASQKYVDNAVLSPLSTGAIGNGYATLFDTGVRAAATGADQNTLTDLAVGKASGYTESATPVLVSALADESGATIYVATRFTVIVKATASRGPVTINRDVELTFAPAAGSGWQVTAYRVRAARITPVASTTTTAVAPGGG